MLRELIANLKAVGKPTELYHTSDGTRILILPYGGRILGVFAPGNDENFLWTNSALDSVESARAYYASDDWQNSGGDRTWLAPDGSGKAAIATPRRAMGNLLGHAVRERRPLREQRQDKRHDQCHCHHR